MPYMRSYRQESNGTLLGFLVGCLAGVVLGAALGVLMAPHRGDITRRKIARRAGETRDNVVEKVEDLMVHRSEDTQDAIMHGPRRGSQDGQEDVESTAAGEPSEQGDGGP